ncbi:MAG: hypothetical protein MK188_00890 [Gammaproteobacteria bacterium]|nr:hypothetical protein [Gammaproteobacteria bacterium]
MKLDRSLHQLGCLSLLPFACMSQVAHSLDLNYEGLSKFEEPIATHIADTTFTLSSISDIRFDLSNERDNIESVSSVFQLGAETQLDNSWTLGAAYLGVLDSEDMEGDHYTDNVAIYLSSSWGSVSLGNVTGEVRENTRRKRGVGNANLNLDNSFGSLSDYGVSYTVRLGPSQIFTLADQDGNIEVGAGYQRPLGNKDYRFSIRFRNTESIQIAEQSFDIESESGILTAEMTYGDLVIDASIGLESLSFDQLTANRKFIALGATRKIGTWSGSVEAYFGELEDGSSNAYSIGLSKDLARGFSLNLGINHQDQSFDIVAFDPINLNDTTATISLRYSL